VGNRRIVGRYEFLQELGRGGMATVYLARQLDLDRLVAVKELGALRTSDPSFAQRFLREARLAGSLSHPNIATVYDYFEHGGVPYIAMEYVERGSLRSYIGSLSLAQIGGALDGVLSGLSHAERQNIVHRDIKPENLLISADGRVKIADFGIAKATNKVQTGAYLTTVGTTVGTPNYMAPEQAMARELGPWTDLYSVGVIAFELFVGTPPFGDTEQPMAVLMRQVKEPIPAVKHLRPEVDPGVSDWIERLVAKEPADRPQTAGEAQEDLEELLAALLGSRWLRAAPLLDAREQPTAHAVTRSRRPTVALGRADLDATVRPQREPPPQDPTEPSKAAPRRPGILVTAVVAAAATAGVLTALAYPRGGSDGDRPTLEAAATAVPTDSVSTALTGSLPGRTTTAEALETQLAEAERLAKRYEDAAWKILGLPDGTKSGNLRLVEALRRTAGAYRTAAAAAGRGDVTAYATAIGAAAAAKRDVDSALSALGGAPSTTESSSDDASDPTQPESEDNDSSSDDPSDEEPEN
jgi:hypothetical protein